VVQQSHAIFCAAKLHENGQRKRTLQKIIIISIANWNKLPAQYHYVHKTEKE
jgi:hypothetical protein